MQNESAIKPSKQETMNGMKKKSIIYLQGVYGPGLWFQFEITQFQIRPNWDKPDSTVKKNRIRPNKLHFIFFWWINIFETILFIIIILENRIRIR